MSIKVDTTGESSTAVDDSETDRNYPMNPSLKEDYYLEVNLRIDYDHLESAKCFCENSKGLGAIFCDDCLSKLPTIAREKLRAIRPGEGLANAAASVFSGRARAARSRG